MELPKRAGETPVAVELEAGNKYAWCTCGLSENQPYCNGAHKGSGMAPQVFTAEKTETKYLCACKSTKNGPFCDGSHK
jgi:CDGSH-type Zn-finger protein